MFGAPVAYLFEYVLGIHQQPNTAGYTSLIISPAAIRSVPYAKGSMETPNGTLSVSYEQKEGYVHFHIVVPERTRAVLRLGDQETVLGSGDNVVDWL
jgi:alpha-L-rhamnosidase